MDLTSTQKERLHNLNGLDEIRMEAIHHTEVVQQQRMKWHDQYIKTKEFNVGDWELLYDSRYKEFKGKLQSRWLGPYEISQFYPNGAVKLHTIHVAEFSLLVNGHKLKLSKKPLQEDDFIFSLSQQYGAHKNPYKSSKTQSHILVAHDIPSTLSNPVIQLHNSIPEITQD